MTISYQKQEVIKIAALAYLLLYKPLIWRCEEVSKNLQGLKKIGRLQGAKKINQMV
jgi:hypothetical protein